MESIQANTKSQWEAIKGIPARVLSLWPGWFTFGVVRMVESVGIALIPPLPGIAGDVLRFALRGAVQMTNHVTFQAITSSQMA